MKKTLLSATALGLLIASPVLAHDTTKKTQTTIKTEVNTKVSNLPNVNEVNFSVFDTNNDGQYSMKEVGERLFDSFDRDDNGSIDNIEWDTRSVMTITPIEKETFKYVDLESDGTIDYSTYKFETFYEESGLMRFDANKNGLSAKEFIETEFQALDNDDNNLIDIEEWKSTYIESRQSSATAKKYN